MIDGKLLFSPTDLARYMDNPYIAWMNRFHLEHPGQLTPDEDTEQDELIQRRGLEHEDQYLRLLQEQGRDICEIPSSPNSKELTLEAMKSGREIIYQAAISTGEFAGFADFLVRVDEPSTLGDHHYQAWDTKLSLKAKPHFIIQLCCYSEMLESIQGRRPQEFWVVLGDGTSKRFRTDDFIFFYLQIREAFLDQQREFDPDNPPDPKWLGSNGRWESIAQKWLQERDHLSLVANIRTDQIKKLKGVGIETIQGLVDSDLHRVIKMQESTFTNLKAQAGLQVASRGLEVPKWEVIEPDPDNPQKGLALLPPASELDVAFDFEGFPLVDGGLEYLWGATHCEAGEIVFTDWWAHDDVQERVTFEGFIDWVCERRERDRGMHVYHYGAYEITALRRLMGKFGTREYELDDLLRHGVFVDLLTVVRQGLRIGEPSYSLKYVEHVYRGRREGGVETAGESIVAYQRWLESQDGPDWRTSEILRQIRDYNRDDCESTWELAAWLRERQCETDIPWFSSVAEEDREKEEPKERTPAALLAEKLLAEIPEDRSEDPQRWRIHELLAWLLEFHWRESKPVWWALFDRHEKIEDELIEDMDCLGGLERADTSSRQVKRSQEFDYDFDPDQDTKIHEGQHCYFAHDISTKVQVTALDRSEGSVTIKAGPKVLAKLADNGGETPQRLSLIPDEYVSAAKIAESIERTVTRYAETGEMPPALRDLLGRSRPRIRGNPHGPIIADETDPLRGATDAAMNMEASTLCFQGPPGSGKTYTAAHIITALLRAGKRIAVSAPTHRAINNLLVKVDEIAEESGVTFTGLKVNSRGEDEEITRCKCVRGISSTAAVFDQSPQLVGGTAWVFSDPRAVDQFDHLFVDEAGQMSLANVVGMAPCTDNIILMGDQMQLGQVIQGSHPGESGLSALEYLLQDHATIPPDLGIFLGTTWRLHPDICKFISEAVYEGRLNPKPHTANRVVRRAKSGDKVVSHEAGVHFVPVVHEYNTQASDEEVDVIASIIEDLLQREQTDADGNRCGALTHDDILIVAPYNMQIRRLQHRLG
jgi:predicted RecB family nuclease